MANLSTHWCGLMQQAAVLLALLQNRSHGGGSISCRLVLAALVWNRSHSQVMVLVVAMQGETDCLGYVQPKAWWLQHVANWCASKQLPPWLQHVLPGKFGWSTPNWPQFSARNATEARTQRQGEIADTAALAFAKIQEVEQNEMEKVVLLLMRQQGQDCQQQCLPICSGLRHFDPKKVRSTAFYTFSVH